MKSHYLGVVLLFGAVASGSAFASDWSGVKYLPRSSENSVSSLRRATPDPVYQKVFASVSQANLQLLLKEMTGGLPVANPAGGTYLVSDRYLPESKAKFRAFWLAYFRGLGIDAQEFSYPTQHSIGESQGHNLEAVLPGKSKDSIVIIVHYDSIGPNGDEANNPGVDDDMSGMAMMLETARILNTYRSTLQKTVRLVAADYEEHSSPGLEGARSYATYIQKLSADQHFKIVAAVDNEQSGWSCATDSACDDARDGNTFDVFSCSGDSKSFDFKAMGDQLEQVATTYSTLKASRGCMGENSDHYAMWEIGVPTVVFSEHDPFNNPHFDQSGGDTYDKIDQAYYFKIAQVGVTFAATLVGLN
jgi:Zn-dependent M28 family amino/carboxypeptidase